MRVDFKCNNYPPSFDVTNGLFHKFDDWEVDATKEIIRNTNRDIRAGKLEGSAITKLYTGHRFLSSSYWREYPIAYGGRQVQRYTDEHVKLEFNSWTIHHWIVAMNLFVVRPDLTSYKQRGDILGCITREMLNEFR